MEMFSSRNSSDERAVEEEKLTIPRGGPIYLSNYVGPITSIPAFQSSLLQELRDVYSLCTADSYSTSDFDISVEELKVFTDEELVDMAMKESFKEGEVAEASSQPSHGHPVSGEEDHTIERSREGTSTTALTKSKSKTVSKKGSKKKKKRRNTNHTKRRNTNHTLEDQYIEKVEQLAKIKQKQDEDKAAAASRLHSLMSGGCKVNDSVNAGSDGTERLKTLRSVDSEIKVKSSRGLRHEPVRSPEVVLCIEVYHSRKTWAKTQEFLVLGRQTLTELRDNIYCITDLVMEKAEEHDPSGYFLIEDVFYNDMRNPSAINYSEPIIHWLRNSKEEALKKWKCITTGELSGKQKAVVGDAASPDLPKFKAADMHRTQFCDLKFRLGAGYMYCHQGDCKHTIVVRDMRLIHPDDVQNRAAYPLLTYQLKLRVRKCNVCKIYRAKLVTVDDKWAQQNPCYFCENCYYLLHHSSNGSLLYDNFLVYDYHPD